MWPTYSYLCFWPQRNFEELCQIFYSPISSGGTWSCRTNQVAESSCRMSGNQIDNWELNTMKGALHLEKSVYQSWVELHKVVTIKRTPLCDFIGTHSLNRWNLSETWMATKPTCPRWESWEAVIMEPCLGLLPWKHGVTSLVTRQSMLGHLYLFYKLWQNVYLRSFILYHSFK